MDIITAIEGLRTEQRPLVQQYARAVEDYFKEAQARIAVLDTTPEQGSLFCVSRGREVLTGGGFLSSGPPAKHYDTSHEGLVYRAVRVEGSLIVAEIAANGKGYGSKRGSRIILNRREVETTPVSEDFLAELLKSPESQPNLQTMPETV